MALTKIQKTGVGADAVDATKIVDDAISDEHLDPTAISGQTELSETAANNDVFLIFDTTAGTLKKIQRTNLVLEVPSVTSISPTTVQQGDNTGNHTFTVTGTKFDGTATAKFINVSGADVAFDSVTRDSTTQLTCVIAKSSLPDSGEPYDIKVTNGSGLAAQLDNQVNVNAQPVFTTAAGSLGSFSEQTAVNVTINATDPESAGNVTFELQSGTLPPGLSLTQEGTEGGTARISGTLSTDRSSSVTSNFTIRAVDAASNTTSRAFSITEVPSGTQSFTSSGTFAVPTGITAVDVLVVAGGGGSGRRGGGGGAGGLIFRPSFPVTPGATVTVTVGCGGGPATTQTGPGMRGVNGQDSVFGTLTAKGGGGSGGAQTGGSLDPAEQPNLRAGLPGGSGGGHARDGSIPVTGAASTATQPTQSGDSGAYGFGNAGGVSHTCSNSGAGGGGGAGAVGQNGRMTSCGPAAPTPVNPAYEWAGQGGVGKAYTIADGTTSVYYSGGGGGTVNCPAPVGPTNKGFGGQGGGGDGGLYNCNTVGQHGTANTGGGAGGGSESTTPVGRSGGKGIVIVKF